MYERKIAPDLDCGVTITQLVIGGKWKPYLIKYIKRGYHRPAELQTVIPDATKRVLTQQLGEMERTGLVERRVFAEVPLRVEYHLTPLGESLIPVIQAMSQWGEEHRYLFDG